MLTRSHLPAARLPPLTRSTTDSTFAVSFFPKDDRVLFTHDKGGDEQNHLFVLNQGVATDLTPGATLKASFVVGRTMTHRFLP